MNIPSWEVRKEALGNIHMFHMQSTRELVTFDKCLVRILAIAHTITQDLFLLFTLGSDSVLHNLQHYDHTTNGVQLTKTNACCTTRESSFVLQWTDGDHGRMRQHPVRYQVLQGFHKQNDRRLILFRSLGASKLVTLPCATEGNWNRSSHHGGLVPYIERNLQQSFTELVFPVDDSIL